MSKAVVTLTEEQFVNLTPEALALLLRGKIWHRRMWYILDTDFMWWPHKKRPTSEDFLEMIENGDLTLSGHHMKVLTSGRVVVQKERRSNVWKSPVDTSGKCNS